MRNLIFIDASTRGFGIDYCSHKHSHILSFYVLALLFYRELFIHLVYYYGLFAFSFVPFVSKLLPSDGDGYKGHTSCVFIIVAVWWLLPVVV